MKTADAYAKVTARLIAELEGGRVPWHRPWVPSQPVSIHGRHYRGINAVLLSFLSPYASPVWLTFNQARERGGCVRKGEKGMPVILFKVSDRDRADADDASDERKARLFATTYTVFNVEQCDGVELPKRLQGPAGAREIVSGDVIAERFLGAGGPSLEHGGSRACYSPSLDSVRIPTRAAFKSSAEYYSTLFHELGHSTGHASRLNRDGIAKFDSFGSHQYSREELVAEFCAAFLCASAGIENARTVENSAAYLRYWLKAVKEEPGVLVRAASQAQKAADLILGVAPAAQVAA